VVQTVNQYPAACPHPHLSGKGEWVTDNISLVSANKETYIAQCSTISSGTYALYYRPGLHHSSQPTNQIKLHISAHEEFCLFIPMCIHGHSSLLQSGFHRFPHAALRHTPLQEKENFSTIIAIAFTVPLVLVASSLAGGAVEMKTEGFNPLGSGIGGVCWPGGRVEFHPSIGLMWYSELKTYSKPTQNLIKTIQNLFDPLRTYSGHAQTIAKTHRGDFEKEILSQMDLKLKIASTVLCDLSTPSVELQPMLSLHSALKLNVISTTYGNLTSNTT